MAPTIPDADPAKLNSHWILGEMLEHLSAFAGDFPAVDIAILTSLLSAIRLKQRRVTEDRQDVLRSFLKVFRATGVYRDALAQLDESIQGQVRDFVDGKRAEEVVVRNATGFQIAPSPGVKHHFRLLDFLKSLFHLGGGGEKAKGTTALSERAKEVAKAKGLPIVYEDPEKKRIMEVYADTPFENWGLSVSNTPKYTFVPTTVYGVTELVKYAKSKNLRVRCAGYRHSWSNTFSADNEILVSLLNLHQVTTIPDISTLLPTPDQHELRTIELAPQSLPGAPDKRLCRVGVSVTNEDFRRWAVAHDAWTLPVDVILVEVTFGGVNAVICHGAGRRNRTLSDLVRQIEYVDCNGTHRTLSDPAQLRAAAGCFGLLGVVTHITLELDAMTYAVMAPTKPDICLAIPPEHPSDIPLALRKTFTAAQYAAAQADFERRAADDYYSEWFWFTYQQKAWVNTWSATADKKGARATYPANPEVWLQWIEGWLGGVIATSRFFSALPGRWQAELLATIGMLALPPYFAGTVDTDIKCPMPDALHFRRGIQNSRVRDMEYQIPIPDDGTGKPDWRIVQRAWWAAIKLVYDDPNTPMRLTLELRIMGASDIIMAPQRGNAHGTASIEVLSTPDAVDDGEWLGFCQRISDAWMGLTDHAGVPLNVRPHWAKEWEKVQLGPPGQRVDAKKWLKDVSYKDAIPEFRRVVGEIGQGQGWTVEETGERFGNGFWEEMLLK
ncbi:hypothetical protein EDC01DRAFT_345122 [Geopyxis carbonaria]|nr:hypothetical protein EDC01DRAFT_345122 [Geopyxis carbonaria]